jgi:hypothetical protein
MLLKILSEVTQGAFERKHRRRRKGAERISSLEQFRM